MSKARVRRRFLAARRYQIHCDRVTARHPDSYLPAWPHIIVPQVDRLGARVSQWLRWASRQWSGGWDG